MYGSMLLIEDDERFRETLTYAFEQRGFAVTSVRSVKAYYGLHIKSFDYAVLDLQLESGSSLPIIPIIKKHSPMCRILILTGFGTITAAIRAIKLGADNLLQKPATIKQIMDALAENYFQLEELPATMPTLDSMERDYIDFVLSRCQGNISETARKLGIHRQSLQRKLKKHTPKRE